MTKLVVLQKTANYKAGIQKLMDRRGDNTPDTRLEKFRKLILEHLSTLDDEEAELAPDAAPDAAPGAARKAVSSMIRMEKGGKGLAVGTVREWKGRKFKKIAPGKWRPVYDGETRGAKMAVSAVKRKIAAAQDAHAMMRIILENRDRFSDKDGQPLPFVQELSKYVAGEQDRRKQAEQQAKNTPQESKAVQPKGGKGENQGKIPEAEKKQAAKQKAGKQNHEAVEPDKSKDDIKEWEQKGADAFYSGKPRKTPYEDIVKPGTKIGSPESKEANKKMEAWLRGWDRADASGRTADPGSVSDFEKIREKYANAKTVEGDEDEIHAGKEIITGKWKLVEADTPTASHDESTFHKTPGFPGNTEESTVNDRDYEHDREAQEVVIEMAGDYDHQAVSIEKPVVVTKDGIVISGNNRTMSSKIAARKGTDTKYIEALTRRAKKFGFTAEQVAQFKHPRVVFETDEKGDYSTERFAKFNDRQEKSMGPISTAVKISKMMKPKTVERIAEKIGEFDTLGELYGNHKACNDIYGILKDAGHVTMQSMPEYMESGYITENGKSFLENVMLGSVITEKNIRGLNREGCKSIRQKLMRAITPLVENKSMNGYSITKELNEAIDIAMQVSIHKDKFKDVTEYSKQIGMFGDNDPIAIEFAKRLETTQKEFSAFMQSVNGGLRYAANGEADVFLGGTESREDILARMLNLKKAISNVLDFFRNLQQGKGPRFVKKAVPIQGENGETEFSERWVQESIESIAPYVEESGISDTGTKVIAVDFDGVINSYISGWKGPAETDAPVLSAAESLKTLYNRGYKVIIFSTRANTQEGIDTIREYLRKHTENNTLADTIEITDKKPIADMYIDDRAIPFAGDWEETLKQIEEFKPWIEPDDHHPLSIETVDLPDGIYEGLRAAYKIRLNNGTSFSTITGIKCSWKHPFPWKVEIKNGIPYSLNKSLTYSGYPLQGRTKVHGMDISIENKKGSVRSGTDKDGHDWSVKMNFDYGYIRGTV